jgi:hypothetical protein
MAKMGATIADPTNLDDIAYYLNKLRIDIPKKYVHTGQMLQMDNFINQLKGMGMKDKKAVEYLEALARANPRKSRRARGNSARRNPYSHENPLAQEDAEFVGAFTAGLSRDKAPDPEKLVQAQRALEKADRSAVRQLDRNKLYTYFPVDYRNQEGKRILDPTTPESQGSWETGKRVKEGLTDQDLMKRVFRGKRTEVIDPFGEPGKSLPVIKEEIEVTAEDAAHILEEQRKKQVSRRRATIPPSAGLCKSTRSKRLMDYSPPDAIKKVTNKDILIWLSPDKITGETPKVVRVLQFRKGNHVDCDLSARALEEDLTSLLSRALQASLFWLTEKPRRDRKVSIWVGRAGTSVLYKAYTPPTDSELGDYPKSKPLPLSMDAIVENLEKGIKGDPAFTRRVSDVDTSTDLVKWAEATQDLSEKTRKAAYQGETTYYAKDGTAYKASMLASLAEEALEALWRQYEDGAKVDAYKKGQNDPNKRRAYYLKKLKEEMTTGNAKPNPGYRNPFRRSY